MDEPRKVTGSHGTPRSNAVRSTSSHRLGLGRHMATTRAAEAIWKAVARSLAM
jgi:hypothetical protein